MSTLVCVKTKKTSTEQLLIIFFESPCSYTMLDAEDLKARAIKTSSLSEPFVCEGIWKKEFVKHKQHRNKTEISKPLKHHDSFILFSLSFFFFVNSTKGKIAFFHALFNLRVTYYWIPSFLFLSLRNYAWLLINLNLFRFNHFVVLLNAFPWALHLLISDSLFNSESESHSLISLTLI